MALGDLYSNLNFLLRWFHVLSGIAWIGHLYFFNFVNLPMQAVLDDAAKKVVNPQLMPRALWWFRWAAMSTFVTGLIVFTMNYMYTPGAGFGPSSLFATETGSITSRAAWILYGMIFASLMWFNVWFVIWPAQKKILGGKAGDQVVALRTRAAKASRMNTFMSGPMLFGMLAPQDYGAVNAVSLIVAALIGGVIIWHCYKVSPKVGTKV